jgi:hypothetical protein
VTEAAVARRKPYTWKTWTIMASLLVPVVIVGYWVLFVTTPQSKVDPAMLALAERNAGGPVQAFTGPGNTVYHSTAPLPSADAPRADAKLTLVWFARTNCSDCAKMRPFAQDVAAGFTGQMVFVEKAVDRDAQAAARNVPSLPYFELLDAKGTVLAQFGYQPDRAAFEAAVQAALTPSLDR